MTIRLQTLQQHVKSHLGNLGLAYRDLGQVERARDYLNKALTIFEEIKFPNAEVTKQCRLLKKWFCYSDIIHLCEKLTEKLQFHIEFLVKFFSRRYYPNLMPILIRIECI